MASALTPPSSLPPPLSSVGSSKTFTQSISQKLHTKNYLLWIQRVEHSHHLEGYIINPQTPPKYASVVIILKATSLILKLLRSMLRLKIAMLIKSPISIMFGTNMISFSLCGCNPLFFGDILPWVVGCWSSWQLSDCIQSLTRAKIRQVHDELWNLSR